MTKITLISSNKIFEGFQNIYSHDSKELKCQMKFAIYLPPNYAADGGDKLPVLYWLSGLTCDENNFIQKAGAQKYAAEHGIIIVCPDTSPRNVDIPGQDDSYDFGSGAGFYINATTDLWRDHYQMFSYVTSELISVISHNFAINTERQGIFGHSMGGHGALVCALRNPGLYKSVSAFAPIANPSNCAWGKKAFTGYLGENEENWKEWDATELVKKYNGPPLTLLIHQGGDDKFLAEKQLLPENLFDACKSSNFPIIYEKKVKYDHSYFFIATFIGAHIEHHAKLLKA